MKSVGLSDEDLVLIRKFSVRENVKAEDLIEDFYIWMSKQAVGRRFFPNGVPTQVEKQQIEYWNRFLNPNIDESYIDSRLAVGRIHVEIQLPPDAYTEALAYICDWLLRRLMKSTVDDSTKLLTTVAINRLCQFDSALVFHSYGEELANSIAILESADRSMAWVEFSVEGQISAANKIFLETFGYELEEIVGKHHQMFVRDSESDSQSYRQFWNQLSQGEFQSGVFRRKDKRGRDVWVQASYNPVLDAFGETKKIIEFAVDVTEQKVLEADNKSKIDAILRSNAVIEFDLDGTILHANDNFLSAVGYQANEVEGHHHRMFVEPHVQKSSAYAEMWAKLRRGEFESGQFKRIASDGSAVWIQASYNPIFDIDGNPIKVVKYAIDITAQKKALEKAARERELSQWYKDGQNELLECMRGELGLESLADNVLQYVARYIGAGAGVLYSVESNGSAVLRSSYMCSHKDELRSTFGVGEGIMGQVVLEKNRRVLDLGSEPIYAEHGLGKVALSHAVLVPMIASGEVQAVLQLASKEPLREQQLSFLDSVSESVAIAIVAAGNRTKMRVLLEESRQKSLEMETQSEELRATNEQLAEQTEGLRATEEELRSQQAELEATNAELEEKTISLAKQKSDIELKNVQVQQAQKELEERAHELELASKYKSEFLANMSHELRTPLNSLLIMAELLTANAEGNLTEQQVEYASVIHSGGEDLLALINDILDLSKVEAGALRVECSMVPLDSLVSNLRRQFSPIAQQKSLEFVIERSASLPDNFETDEQRCAQVLKNLLSNAFKFTSSGSVTLHMDVVSRRVRIRGQAEDRRFIQFSVVDTGIGIPQAKQREIFEAFQQADGSTSRQYGGTGLGLTISRELSKLLGGFVEVSSEEGKGSTFRLYLPETFVGEQEGETAIVAESTGGAQFSQSVSGTQSSTAHKSIEGPTETESNVVELRSGAVSVNSNPAPVADDRSKVTPDKRAILIVEDDPEFSKVLRTLTSSRGYLSLIASTGREALDLAKQHNPAGILLDLGLPDMDGMKLLEHLKFDLQTRHIPVHVVSGRESNLAPQQKGAVGYLQKPISADGVGKVIDGFERLWGQERKKVLLVEDDQRARESARNLIASGNVEVTEAATGQEALDCLNAEHFDCMILDLGLPDFSGQELLQKLSQQDKGMPPVVVHTNKDLNDSEIAAFDELAASVVLKSASSPERLLDEVMLFLHSMESSLPDHQREVIQMLHDPAKVLQDRLVLIVDDDMRNIFALSSVLQKQGMKVLKATNGQEALDVLEKQSGIDLVIMDIMMPVMDGCEAIRRIRAQSRFERLPIVALTAKAMTEDRQQCLEAGASDYLTKPLNSKNLISLMRVLLFDVAA